MGYMSTRKKMIAKYLLKGGITKIKELEKKYSISEKTVSNSLKEIEIFLLSFNVKMVKKQNVGVYLEGNRKDLDKAINFLNRDTSDIPSTKDERVVYIFAKLLRRYDYLTINNLVEELFISKRTIKSDLLEVEKLLKKDGIRLHKNQGKGFKILVTERKRRELISNFIYYFWKNNWYLKKDGNKIIWEFDLISANIKGIFSDEYARRIIKILSEFTLKTKFCFTDYSFKSIVIHLAIAVERIKNEKYIELLVNSLENYIPNLQEHNALILKNLLEMEFNITIPKAEFIYIIVLLMAANYSIYNNEICVVENTITKDELKEFISESLDYEDCDEELLSGVYVHILSILNRLKLGMNIKNPFVDEIKQNYAIAFDKALYLNEALSKKYCIQINDDETAYLALHYQAFFEREKNSKNMLDVILVCSTGLGSSRLVSAKLKKYFNNINIKRILSVQELIETKIEADVIISTIYLEQENINTIIISPLMSKLDIKLIEKNITNIQKNKEKYRNYFVNLINILDERNIFINLEVSNLEELIQHVGAYLIENGFANKGLIESAIRREKLSYTSFNNIAMPHAEEKFTIVSTISIITLKKPILWGQTYVDIVFFIVLKKNNKIDLDKLYKTFFEFIDNKKNLDLLSKAKTVSEIYRIIKGDF